MQTPDYSVVRTFGLWAGARHYRLVEMHDGTPFPHVLQYGEAHEDGFTIIDGHRQDAGSGTTVSPEQWAYEWVTSVYDARRLLNYDSTLRLYARAQRIHAHLLDGEGRDAEAQLENLLHIRRDLNARAGFDIALDFPELERMELDRGSDTMGPDTMPTRWELWAWGDPATARTMLLPIRED